MVVGGLAMLAWVVALGLAVYVAVLAEERGQPPFPWFLVGLFLPVIGLLILLIAFPRQAVAPPPSAEDAVAASTVARELAATPRLSVHQLVERTGLPEREVLSQLRALETLARAGRDEGGRWDLTPT